MNTEQVQQARELLTMMVQEDTKITIQRYDNGYRTDYEKVSANTIEWLIKHGLLIGVHEIDVGERFVIELFKVTELGSLVEQFQTLSNEWDMVETEGLDNFYLWGNAIYNILQKYNSDEVSPLHSLITVQEQEAYNQYYRQKIQDILKDRAPQKVAPSLSTMFNMSVLIGQKGSNETRTNDYVFKKCMEELGEMALEDQIENGLSYKEAGSDGVKGEAVDLAICAMDMFALQCPDMSSEEIEQEFLKYMEIKINKWSDTLK